MAAPTHYIRTIHTSFTATHPHSSTAWANVRSQHQYLPFSTSLNSHNSQLYQQHLQQQHNYHHHEQQHYVHPRKSTLSITATPNPAGTKGRRRAGSICSPPYVKFDPFADEPPSAPSSPLAPSSQVNRISYTRNNTYNKRDYHPPPPPPLTIHIPAAAPTEIKRYSTSPTRLITNSDSGGGSTFLGGSTIVVPTLNPSKLVAGILLNRVHAVGKPMRRRLPIVSGPKQYVKSGLSSVVSVEA